MRRGLFLVMMLLVLAATAAPALAQDSDAGEAPPLALAPVATSPLSAPFAAAGTSAAASPMAGAATLLGFTAAEGPSEVSSALRIAFLLTMLAVLPTLVMMTTSFVRLVIVFHFVRQAIGSQTMPPNQVLIGLALFLSLFIMSPVTDRVYAEAWQPYAAQEIGAAAALEKAAVPAREFMVKNSRRDDLALFTRLARLPQPGSIDDLPFRVVVPSFLVSEMRTGFEIGFLLFLPFLVIDLVVSAVLLSLGMMMLPPVTVSFPFKILLFVMVDGWSLLASSLVRSFA